MLLSSGEMSVEERNLKGLIRKLYRYLTEPIYARLSRDLTLQVQSALSVNLEYQEKIASRIVDELTAIQIEKAAGPNAPQNELHAVSVVETMTDEEIKVIVNQMSTHVRIIEVACENQISVRELMEMRARYAGMGTAAIRKVRLLEKENLRLKQYLTRVTLENSVDTETGIFS